MLTHCNILHMHILHMRIAYIAILPLSQWLLIVYFVSKDSEVTNSNDSTKILSKMSAMIVVLFTFSLKIYFHSTCMNSNWKQLVFKCRFIWYINIYIDNIALYSFFIHRISDYVVCSSFNKRRRTFVHKRKSMTLVCCCYVRDYLQ